MNKAIRIMQKKAALLLTIFGVLLYSLFILHHLAHAQETLGIRDMTVTPPTVTLNLDPGGKTEGNMKLVNNSSDDLTFSVDTQDFIVTDPHGVPSLLPPNTYSPKYSAAAWVGVDSTIFTIKAHEKIQLHYFIQLPNTARPGGHYTALIFKPQTPGTPLDSSGASVQTQIGTLFSVHVNGPIAEKATVDSFFANNFQEYGPVKVLTAIKNMGDSDITPKGTISVYNLFGQKVTSFYLDDHRVFPEAVRDYENTFGGKWLIGKYTAKLVASYGQNNNLPLVAELSFWVFPWKVAIIILLIIVALILGIILWRRRKNKPDTTPTEPTTPIVPTQPTLQTPQ